MKLKALLTLAVASLCSWQGAWADDVVANVTLKEKNSLSTEILALANIDDVKTVTHLTVTTNQGVQLGDEDWTTLKAMTALVELDLSNASAEAVPENEFSGCCYNLVTVSLPKDLKTIGNNAFDYGKDNLVTVVVPSTVTSIGDWAFRDCYNLETCDISACQLETIPNYCFSNCHKLHSFTIPSTVKTIGGWAFYHCYAFTSTLPAGLTSIGYEAFRDAAMTDIDVVIPEGGYVGMLCFDGSGIRSIEFPTTSYRYDDINVFGSCSNLQTVTFKSPTLIGPSNYVEDVASNITLKVPSHLVVAYKSNPKWSNYKAVEAISPAVTDYMVQTDLNLSNSAMRMEGTPNVFFTENASLNIAGNATQTFGDFTASATTGYYGSFSIGTMILNETADVTVTGEYKQRFYTEGGWRFLCLPFDFVVGDVTTENGAFVIRTYNGARRNTENVSSGNWSANLGADVEIKAGTGFIIQTSEKTWVTFKAKAGGTNLAFSKESDELKIPLAPNNSNSEASKANTGWNMVGNPWQAYYNIHKMNYTAPFAVFNYDGWGRNYETYSPADDDYALSPLQAIFVQCPDGISSIDFPADGRQLTSEVTSQNAVRRLAQSGRQLFDIEVSDGSLRDKTRLVVNADATLDYEIGRDASKFFANGSLTPQIFSLDSDGTQYAINERPADSGALRLGILFAEDGKYTLSAIRNDIGQVILTDHETGIKTDLQQQDYTFDAQAGMNNVRFTLSFGGATTGISTVMDNEAAEMEVYTLDGTKVGSTANGMEKGVYVVRQGQQTKKVIIK